MSRVEFIETAYVIAKESGMCEREALREVRWAARTWDEVMAAVMDCEIR